MNELANQQLLVLVERHLAIESQLADSLDEMNKASAAVFANAGVRGPSQSDLETLEPMMSELQVSATQLTQSRQTLLDRINRQLDTEFTRLRQYIRTLPKTDRARLNAARSKILDRATSAQANLIHNQAVLFYTFDFHRKYLAGVLQTDLESQNYRADGQSNTVNPGNIIGKTC